MKLSKKLVAVVLTMVMVAAQVSVFPFAQNSYTSGMGDTASYAMKIPDDVKVVSARYFYDGRESVTTTLRR